MPVRESLAAMIRSLTAYEAASATLLRNVPRLHRHNRGAVELYRQVANSVDHAKGFREMLERVLNDGLTFSL